VLLLAAYSVGAGALGAALPGALPPALALVLLGGLLALLLPLPLLALRTGGLAARPRSDILGKGCEEMDSSGDGAAQRCCWADGCADLGADKAQTGCSKAGLGQGAPAAAGAACCEKAARGGAACAWAGPEEDDGLRAPLLGGGKVRGSGLRSCLHIVHGAAAAGRRVGNWLRRTVPSIVRLRPAAVRAPDTRAGPRPEPGRDPALCCANAPPAAEAALQCMWPAQGGQHGWAIAASARPPHGAAACDAPAPLGAAPAPPAPSLAAASGPVVWAGAAAIAPADLSLVQCAASPDYWALFGVLGAGTGCGLLFSNNLGARRARGSGWRTDAGVRVVSGMPGVPANSGSCQD